MEFEKGQLCNTLLHFGETSSNCEIIICQKSYDTFAAFLENYFQLTNIKSKPQTNEHTQPIASW